MRAKEGIDAQAKMAQRTVEKQNKLLEKAQEVERSLQSQISAQEQAVTQLKNAMIELQRQATTMSSEKSSLEHQLQHTQKHLAEAQQVSCVYDIQSGQLTVHTLDNDLLLEILLTARTFQEFLIVSMAIRRLRYTYKKLIPLFP